MTLHRTFISGWIVLAVAGAVTVSFATAQNRPAEAAVARPAEGAVARSPDAAAARPADAAVARPADVAANKPVDASAGRPVDPVAAKPLLDESWVKELQWRCIGPANMGGRITALAVYEKDPSMWWVGTASGGLLKTVNNGVSFEHQFDHEHTCSVGDVAVFQSDANIVWVGTGEANPRNSVSWGDGVYRSTDGGKTWTHCGLKGSFQIGQIALHPTDPNVAYVGALGRLWGPNEERGLYKTVDGGKTWEKTLHIDDQTGVIDVQMKPGEPDTLLAATYERQRDIYCSNDPAKKIGPGTALYRTTDGGRNWVRITRGLPTSNLGRIGLDFFRKDPSLVYMVLESEQIGKEPANAAYMGLRGEDANVGARLTEITAGGPAEKAGLKVGDIVLAVDDETVHTYNDLNRSIKRRLAGEQVRVEVSRERKSVFADVVFTARPTTETAPPPAPGNRQSAPDRSGPPGRTGSQEQASVPFSSGLGGQRENVTDQQGPQGHEYGGVYVSRDSGESWTRINSVNPRPMYFSEIRVDPSDSSFLYVLGISLYRSKDGGMTFTADGGNNAHPDHHALWIDARDGRHQILGNDGGLYVSYDRQDHWDHLNHMAIGQFYHVAVDSRRDYRVYGGLQDNGSWGGPSRSRSDSGPINQDWISIGGGDGFVCAVDPTDADQVYFESQNGGMGRYNLRTGERGFIRPETERELRYRWNWKTPITLSNHNSKILYAAANYVFRSLKQGDQMKRISPEITRTDQGSASALAESKFDPDVVYVGTDDGAFWVTTNGGHDWTKLVDFPPDADKGEAGKGGAKKSDSLSSTAESVVKSLLNAAGLAAGLSKAKDEKGTAAPLQAATSAPPPAAPPVSAAPPPAGAPPGVPAPPPGAAGPGGMLQMLQRMDANGDGKILKDEVPERMQGMFDRMDTNKDGAIDKDEIAAASERFRSRGGPPGGRGGNPPPSEGPPPGQGPPPSEGPPPGATPPQADSGHGPSVTQSAPGSQPPVSEKPAGSAPTSQAPPPQAPPTQGPPAAPPAAGASASATTVTPSQGVPAAPAPAPPAAVSSAPPAEGTPTGAAATAVPSGADDPLTGVWSAQLISDQLPPGAGAFTLTFKLESGGNFVGTVNSQMGEDALLDGKFDAASGKFSFASQRSGMSMSFAGTIKSGKISGHLNAEGGMFEADFEGTRTSTVVPAALAAASNPQLAAAPDAKKDAPKPEGATLTKLLPGWRYVSSIETSRHKKGRVYVTFDGHRSNDDEPYAFTSEDEGKTWRSLRGNLPTSAGSTKALREDVVNENILYLGTEFGAYVTIDRGATWTRLNGTLPTVAVHDFAVHPTAGEVVAATHGRSLWILDVTPIRQMSDKTVTADAWLFRPGNGIYWRPQPGRGDTTRRFVGENPPDQVQVFYALKSRAQRITLEIQDPAGEAVCKLEPKNEAGLHKATWDLRRTPPEGQPQQNRFRGGAGLVPSGEYVVALKVDGKTLTEKLQIQTDPEFPDYRPWERGGGGEEFEEPTAEAEAEDIGEEL
ncbi:MAG: PDZ domain-containing protein [Phycisphaerales bacterium]|nr:PDZ domain-containing protein [Phycisphaerales bacterium]